MYQRNIKINGIKNIVSFVTAANSIPCDLDICSGKYYLDAKSAMGLMTIDTTKIIQLHIQTEDVSILQLADQLLEPYIVEKKEENYEKK